MTAISDEVVLRYCTHKKCCYVGTAKLSRSAKGRIAHCKN